MKKRANANQNYNEVPPHMGQNGHHKKSTNSKFWRGCGEKGTLRHCWWECKLVQPLWRTVWSFLSKLKIELWYNGAIPLLGIYLEKTLIWKGICTPIFMAALFTIARTWKRLKCPSTKGWIKNIWYIYTVEYTVQFSCSALSDSLRPHELQHTRPPCPSPTPGVYSNSCPSSRWCHPAISSSVVPVSSCPQSLPASGSFPMSQLFAWGGQRTGVSASASVLPMNTQDLSPLGWTGWISLQSKGLSRVFSNTTVQKHQFFGAQLSSQWNITQP